MKKPLILLIIIPLLILLAAGVVLAVDGSDYFELDGNAADDDAAGIDWENVFLDDSPESVFITDADDDDIFTSGGSKDTNDLGEWAHTTGNVPDKDDLLHAYFLAADLDEGLTFYFGADRLANNGDSQMGFWFLQDEVTLEDDGSFSGTHQDGDLLVVSNFVGGGDESDLLIYRWEDGGLVLVEDAAEESAYSLCTDSDDACVFTNEGDEDAPWDYEPKFGDAGTFPAVSFVEGGVNVSALLGADGVGCYSSFVVETRSSHSEEAQLQDLITGSINTCELSIEKDGDALSMAGETITYRYTLENTGATTLYAVSMDDDNLGDIVAAAAESCGTIEAGESCSFEANYEVSGDDPDPITGDVTAVYAARADGSGGTVSATDGHETDLFQPAIAFDKDGNRNEASVGDTVEYVLTLENTSSDDAPYLTCTVTDEMLGVDEAVILSAGDQYNRYLNYTIQSNDGDSVTNTASVSCQVAGFSAELSALDDFTVAIVAAAAPTDKPTPDSTDDTEDPTPEPTDDETVTVEPKNEPSQSEEVTDTPEPEEDETPEPVETQEPEKKQESEAASTAPSLTGLGCSPGFWQGGKGRWLWNEANDPNWGGTGSNPFVHDTLFNDVFAPHPDAAGMTVYQFVRRGGGPNPWRKAARSVVAGYLNASYGLGYPFSAQEVAQMWVDAMNGSRDFMDVHQILDEANNLGCEL